MNGPARERIAAAKNSRDPLHFPVHAGDGAPIAWFRAATPSDLDDEKLIAAMTAWRIANQAAFLARFPASPARTRAWLADAVLADPDRILFLITDGTRAVYGQYGAVLRDGGIVELDNALRAPDVAPPRRLFQYAARALVAWSFDPLAARAVTARILSNNFRSLSTTEAAGLRIIGTVGLRETADGDTIRYAPVDNEALVNTGLRLALLRRDAGMKEHRE